MVEPMGMAKTGPRLVGLLVLAAVLGGCGGRAEVSLGSSAAVTVHVELKGFFAAYLADLTGREPEGLFDEAGFRAALAGLPGVSLAKLSRPGGPAWSFDVSVKDLPGLLQARGDIFGDVLTLRSEAGIRDLSLRLGRAQVRSLLALLPSNLTDLAGALLPPKQGAVTRKEYLEYLSWAFEEYLPPEGLEKGLAGLSLALMIRPEGKILGQQGGVLRGGGVEFSIPLLEVLTAAEPRVLSLRYAAP